MSHPVDVNIWVVTYNHSKYVRQALDGILMQKTDFTWNIVLYDDASTDNTQEIIREYILKYPDKFVPNLSNENIYSQGKSSLSLMSQHFNGKYIAVCEGDDYWIDPYKLQKQYDIMEKNSSISACYHNISTIDKNGTQHDIRKCYTPFKTHIYDKTLLQSFRLPGQTATLFMRNFFTILSPQQLEYFFSCKMNGDIKFSLLLAQIGDIYCIEDTMAAHRIVWDEGDSYTARLHRGEINPYIQRYNNYTEAKYFLKNAFNNDFPDFEYKCEILIEILFVSFKLQQFKIIKTFFKLLFQRDYTLRQKLIYLFSKLIKFIKHPYIK